jgi:23S rRNA (guanosine2251-2'-O)-methyltransferase
MEAMKEGKEFDKILLQKGVNSPYFGEMFKIIRMMNIHYQYVPVQKLDRITRKNHQGVIGFTSLVSYMPLDEVIAGVYEKGKTPLILILDKVTDVRNLGAITRTAECAGVDAVVFPRQNSAQINSDAIKSSAGALLKIPLCREENLKETILNLKNSGLKIVAATEKTDTLIYDSDMTVPLAIIMGSEGEGISGEYLKLADEKVAIPIAGEIESLNVSAATSVVLYEAVRQRSAK